MRLVVGRHRNENLTVWTFEPKIPLGLWWALAAAATVAVVYYALRRDWPVSAGKRFVLTILLGLGIVGPLLIALNPIWVETIPPLRGSPQMTVLVDGTQSMRTPDAKPNQTSSRWTYAITLADLIDGRGTKIDVIKNVFADTIVPLPSEQQSANTTGTQLTREGDESWPRGHRSDLAGAIRQTTKLGSPLGNAIVLISDGAHNVGSVESVLQAAQESDAMATPIYTITVGTSVGLKNMSLAARSPRMIAFPNSTVSFSVRLGHNGLKGQTTQLSLIEGDKVIQTQPVTLRDDPNQEVRFVVEPSNDASLQRFRVVASEIAGEATVSDNQTTILVQHLQAPIGVLLLEGKPYWDSKFLARNLGSDSVVELTSIVKLSESRYLQKKIPRELDNVRKQTDPVEASADEIWSVERELNSPLESPVLLETFRVVVLGRDSDVFLTDKAIENVCNWVSRKGGCLLCARGAPSDRIAAKIENILPIRWSNNTESRFRTQVSRYGLDAAVFDPLLKDGDDPLSAMPSLAATGVPKPRSALPQVLVQSISESDGATIPVVTYQPFGTGLTIVVEGAGMWRWAFLPPQHANKDKVYPTLWQSLIQWIVSQQDLMPGQEVAIRSDRAAFLTGDRVTASIVTRESSKLLTESGQLDVGILLESSDSELPKRFNAVPSGVSGELFQVDFGILDVGYYTAKIVQGDQDTVLASTAIEVRDPWFESLEVDARPDVMRRIATLSGGSELKPEELAGLAKRVEQRIDEQNPTKEIRKTLWDHPLVLFVILFGWITTWIVRRQSGVV
ncbi:MAG: hypothetical protein ABL921_03495 [Pirellula sp.]